MDTILPSASNYKINIQINDLTLDDCSYVMSRDVIQPFFENSVSNDQDVTGLLVFLKNSNGTIMGQRVVYILEQNGQDDNDSYSNDIIIPVKTFDYLPSFPIPENLPPAMYTMVSHVMSGKNILQRIEKPFYYLNSMDFSYNGIDVYLPGIAVSSQLIPRGTVIMLEANVDHINSIDPYIIWYEGRNKISEGYFSGGAGQLFWKTPEKSGFFYLHAEVFPVRTNNRLAGYRKDISLLVSTIAIDVHLVSDNIQQLMHWYTFESSLNDSKTLLSAESALRPAGLYAPKWMGFNKTYGLLTGNKNPVSLPRITIPDNRNVNVYQAVFRFFPVNDGEIFYVIFEPSGARLQLLKKDHLIILTLSSGLNAVSQIYNLQGGSLAENASSDRADNADQNTSFLIAGVNITIQPESITADINILSNYFHGELNEEPVVIETKTDDAFLFYLGSQDGLNAGKNETEPESAVIWDEFALYHMPPINLFSVRTALAAGEEP